MKTLHLPIIIILIISLSTNQVFAPSLPLNHLMTVQTDKPAYAADEPIIISGKIIKDDIREDRKVQIQIFNPYNEEYLSDSVDVSADGSYTFKLNFECKIAVYGDYKVVATYGTQKAETVFVPTCHGTNFIASPLKQIKSGSSIYDIRCKENFQLVFKVRDGSPACVKQSSILRLVTQGWTIPSNLGSQVIAQLATDVAMQDESVRHLISGNDTYVRSVQQGVSFKDDCPFFSCTAILIDKVDANETLVVIVSTATQKVIDVKTTPGWIQTTIQPKESTRLIPSDPLLLPQEEFAKILVKAADDKILQVSRNETLAISFDTNLGYLTLNKNPKPPTVTYVIKSHFDPISGQAALDYVKQFLQKINYKLDGSEQFVDIGSISQEQIFVHQLIRGQYINDHYSSFKFYNDSAIIELGRWYENASTMDLNVTESKAKETGYEFMKSEIKTNSTLQELKIHAQYPTFVSLEVIDDRLVYLMDVGVGPNNHPETDSPNWVGVMVDTETGKVIGWKFGESAP